MPDASWVSRWGESAPKLRSLLRIMAAFGFMQVGSAKLFAFPGPLVPGGTPVKLVSWLGLAGVLETFGGALLFVGLFARPIAFVLAGEMAVAYFWKHAPRGFWTVLNAGQPALLYCFIWLYLSAADGGPWSVDAIRRSSREARQSPEPMARLDSRGLPGD
jgi:putative oxidoreductase